MRQASRIVYLLLALLCISCSTQKAPALVGSWQEVNGKEAIEFQKDGTFRGSMIWDRTKAPVNISGTYTMEGNNVSLKLQNPGDLVPMVWQIELSNSDKELKITYRDGGALKLDGTSATYRRAG